MPAKLAAVLALTLMALQLLAPVCAAQCLLEDAGAGSSPAAPAAQGNSSARSTPGQVTSGQVTSGQGTPGQPARSMAAAGMASAGGGRSLFALPAGDDPLQASPGLTLTQPDPYRPYQNGRPAAVLEAGEVTARLRARGFVDVSGVRQRGRAFLAEATGPRGERVRLVIDAASGEISGMQVIGFGPAH